MVKNPIIRDSRVQAFIDQAKSAETMSVIVQIASPALSFEREDEARAAADATDMLPSRASADKAQAFYEEWKKTPAQAELQRQKLQAFDEVLKKLGLTQQATRNTLAGTVALDVTPEQLKKLASASGVGAIVENKHRRC